MASSESLDVARERFRRLVEEEQALRHQEPPDVEGADTRIEATERLVDGWDAQDGATVQAILVPLLDDMSAAVRCAAASYLLYHGATERALMVLDDLAGDESVGSVATEAAVAVRFWTRQQRA